MQVMVPGEANIYRGGGLTTIGQGRIYFLIA